VKQAGALRLYLHTIGYLKLRQLFGRAVFRLRRPRLDMRPAPPRREVLGDWYLHAWREPTLLGPDTFRFLNQTRSLTSASDWNHPDWDKLWLYNLHYLDDLAARDSALGTD